MTEDYKKNLIDYVTCLLNNEQPQDKDFNIINQNFKEYKDSFNDFFDELNTQALRLEITGILETEKYDVSILYGGYLYRNTSASLRGRGFLIYLDKNNNVIDVIFKDKNGNPLRGFHKLYFDEDTNRIYGVLGHPTVSPENFNENNYFCYINNLFLKIDDKYQFDIIKSYALNETNLRVLDIVKNPNSSSYLMIGTNTTDSSNVRILQYTINVGEPSELKKWNVVPSLGMFGNYYWTGTDLLGHYLWYSSDTPHFKVIFGGLNYNSSTSPLNGKYYGLAVDNGDNVSYTRLSEIPNVQENNTGSIWRYTGNYQYNVLSTDQNTIYFVVVYQNNTEDTVYFQTKIQKFDGTNVIDLYKGTVVSTPSNTWRIHNCEYYNFYKDTDNTIYLVRYLLDINENLVNTSLINFSKYSINLAEENWLNLGNRNYEGNDKIYTNFTISQRNYNINKIYNISGLISILIFTQANLTGYILTLTNLFSINGYNGDAYSGVDVLVPKLSNLYSNGSLEFSRNLYNVSKQNNMTMSSVEIPNNYLNDTMITQNDLISKTNLQLNSNNQQWTKNVYEVVDLNFLNTITVIDEDTGVEYLESAIKINNAITDGGDTNYQNTPCTKYRINYTDETTNIENLVWTSIDDTHKETEITIYVDKPVLSIDFLSHDETTIYLTIPLEVEVGNYYTINQKIKIGE